MLKATAPKLTFEQINFVAGKRGHGAVVENDFYNQLKRLSIQAGKKDKILTAHVQRICGWIGEHTAFSGHEMRGPAGNGHDGVSMAGGRQGQDAGKEEGVRRRRLPSPPCFFRIYMCISTLGLDEGGC